MKVGIEETINCLLASSEHSDSVTVEGSVCRQIASWLSELKEIQSGGDLDPDTKCKECGHDPYAGTRRVISRMEKEFRDNNGEVGTMLGAPVTSEFSKEALMGCLVVLGKEEGRRCGDMIFHVICPSCRDKRDHEHGDDWMNPDTEEGRAWSNFREGQEKIVNKHCKLDDRGNPLIDDNGNLVFTSHKSKRLFLKETQGLRDKYEPEFSKLRKKQGD